MWWSSRTCWFIKSSFVSYEQPKNASQSGSSSKIKPIYSYSKCSHCIDVKSCQTIKEVIQRASQHRGLTQHNLSAFRSRSSQLMYTKPNGKSHGWSRTSEIGPRLCGSCVTIITLEMLDLIIKAWSLRMPRTLPICRRKNFKMEDLLWLELLVCARRSWSITEQSLVQLNFTRMCLLVWIRMPVALRVPSARG